MQKIQLRSGSLLATLALALLAMCIHPVVAAAVPFIYNISLTGPNESGSGTVSLPSDSGTGLTGVIFAFDLTVFGHTAHFTNSSLDGPHVAWEGASSGPSAVAFLVAGSEATTDAAITLGLDDVEFPTGRPFSNPPVLINNEVFCVPNQTTCGTFPPNGELVTTSVSASGVPWAHSGFLLITGLGMGSWVAAAGRRRAARARP